jgi:hypothetical protein
VRLAIDADTTALHSGAEYVAYYRTLTGALPDTDGLKVLLLAREKFADLVNGVHSLRVIRDAILAVTRGNPKVPVHYPRVRPKELDADVLTPPDPRGRNFEWFTENDRTGKDAPQRALRSLPSATDSAAPLTVYEVGGKKTSNTGPRRNGQGGRNRKSSR